MSAVFFTDDDKRQKNEKCQRNKKYSLVSECFACICGLHADGIRGKYEDLPVTVTGWGIGQIHGFAFFLGEKGGMSGIAGIVIGSDFIPVISVEGCDSVAIRNISEIMVP